MIKIIIIVIIIIIIIIIIVNCNYNYDYSNYNNKKNSQSSGRYLRCLYQKPVSEPLNLRLAFNSIKGGSTHLKTTATNSMKFNI